jgi:hypothetical protein
MLRNRRNTSVTSGEEEDMARAMSGRGSTLNGRNRPSVGLGNDAAAKYGDPLMIPFRLAAACLLALTCAVPALACVDRYDEDFRKHPAQAYDGGRKPVDFASHPIGAKLSEADKARIRLNVATGPNFAGAYHLLHVRCPYDCTVILVVSVATGKIHRVPGRGALFADFRADSNFLAIRSPDTAKVSYYLFDGATFRPTTSASDEFRSDIGD